MMQTNPHRNAAIVTTLRNAGGMIDSFIAYHLAIGFGHLFLFFDDPADPDLTRLASYPQITAVAHDPALRRQWQTMPEYSALRSFLDTEVMARQTLNVGVAMEMAREQGFGWLLHIDSDELFYTPHESVAAHFAAADKSRPGAIQYFNFEAVPETDDIADPFRQVDLFKIPPSLGPGPYNPEGEAVLRATPQLPQGLFFHFYSNGKSAVRLDARGMRPAGVHGFDGPEIQPGSAAVPPAYILHYACCGFESFWTKYRTLGDFSDRWLDKDDIRSAIGSLHLDARDVVAKGDRSAGLAFYRQRIAITDLARADALIRHGILLRISEPRQVLGALQQEISP